MRRYSTVLSYLRNYVDRHRVQPHLVFLDRPARRVSDDKVDIQAIPPFHNVLVCLFALKVSGLGCTAFKMLFVTSFPWGKVPDNSSVLVVLLILSSCVTSTTLGFDGSMMNSLNELPSYIDYFDLDTTTIALNTSSVWIGCFVIGLAFAKVPDYIGRKPAMFWAALLTLFAVILQTASQNIAMFVTARILIGVGTGASSVAAPVYLAEILPMRWRGVGLAIIYDFW